MATMPTRIDGELFEAARAAGAVHSRSAAQQLDHWARLGQQLESAPDVTVSQVEDVLAGRASYDALGDHAQALVRARWEERIVELRAANDVEGRLVAAGDPWFEVDARGALVERRPGA